MECHCSSGKDFKVCCEPLLSGEKKATNAEELMRSRYCAFVEKKVDYIISSHHPETSGEIDKDYLKGWSENSKWLGLEIISADNEEGKIEFKCHYELMGKRHTHHELSHFKKLDDTWMFVDGDMLGSHVVRIAPKLGRNDPCHCGSEKKFKKCCLKLA